LSSDIPNFIISIGLDVNKEFLSSGRRKSSRVYNGVKAAGAKLHFRDFFGR
jgi:hypothetical protein